ncbi:hypothetical protein [Myxococcus eversor]|uniref:hypothetical protein n=1 Tax=Myxococcus eversor TaxID=2709661 RepID=UPI0013D76A35|nr:hypothetical protein [Myxococcus eversor]
MAGAPRSRAVRNAQRPNPWIRAGARLDAIPEHIAEQLATWEQYAELRPLLYEYGFPRRK